MLLLVDLELILCFCVCGSGQHLCKAEVFLERLYPASFTTKGISTTTTVLGKTESAGHIDYHIHHQPESGYLPLRGSCGFLVRRSTSSFIPVRCLRHSTSATFVKISAVVLNRYLYIVNLFFHESNRLLKATGQFAILLLLL